MQEELAHGSCLDTDWEEVFRVSAQIIAPNTTNGSTAPTGPGGGVRRGVGERFWCNGVRRGETCDLMTSAKPRTKPAVHTKKISAPAMVGTFSETAQALRHRAENKKRPPLQRGAGFRQ